MNLLLGGAQRGQLISAALDGGRDGSDAEAGSSEGLLTCLVHLKVCSPVWRSLLTITWDLS